LSTQTPQLTPDQILNNMRNELTIIQSRLNELSLASFDKLSMNIRQLLSQIETKNSEIKRLEELCKKNNIESSIKKVEKPPIISPAKK